MGSCFTADPTLNLHSEKRLKCLRTECHSVLPGWLQMLFQVSWRSCVSAGSPGETAQALWHLSRVRPYMQASGSPPCFSQINPCQLSFQSAFLCLISPSAEGLCPHSTYLPWNLKFFPVHENLVPSRTHSWGSSWSPWISVHADQVLYSAANHTDGEQTTQSGN